MYLTNKYTKWYETIIARAQQRVNAEEQYFEKHHIVPKSLGGSNDRTNLVNLTAKEHFICHLLLPKMTEGEARTKMRYAAWMMTKNNPYQSRVHLNSRRFQVLREQMALANKERPGPNLGLSMPPETKSKISAALKGKKQPVRTAEHSAKLGQYYRTPENRLAISAARKAQTGLQKRSVETKEKMSAWQKGITKPKVQCPHCGKEMSQMNLSRWHGDNCKVLR